MHLSAHADISRLARCSKALLRAASTPFAWLHATGRFDSSRQTHPSANAATTFSRVHYLWRASCDYTTEIVQADVDKLLATPLKIDHLDASWNTHIDAKFWLHVLRSPLMQRVSRLTFHRGLLSVAPHLPREVIQPLFRLPRLHTLDIGFLAGSGFSYTMLKGSELTSSLTSLTIRDSCQLHYATTLQHFAQCPLKYLSISHSGLSTPLLCAFLQSPALSGLESLRIDEHYFMCSPEVLEIVLTALPCLHTLHARRCGGVDDLVKSLHHSPSLRHFIYESRAKLSRSQLAVETFSDFVMEHVPPTVQLTLVLFPPTQPAHSLAANRLAQRLQKLYPGRAHVQFAERRLQRTDYPYIPVPRWRRRRLDHLPSRPIGCDPSAFGALPAVLVQLMFRDLSLVEKLRFARCNHRLLSMANSASVFAFDEVSLTVTPTRLLMLPLDQNFSGLLRFIPIRLVFSPTDSLWIVRKLITLFHAQPQLRLAAIDARPVQHPVWPRRSKKTREIYCRFFSQYALLTCKAIFLPSITDSAVFEALSYRAELETLQVDLSFMSNALHHSECTSAFTRFTMLKTLHLVNPTAIDKLFLLLYLPALRFLILQPTMVAIPTASLLSRLLQDSPALHITLIAKPKKAKDNYNDSQRDAVMHGMLKAVITDVPSRFHNRLRLLPAGMVE